MIIIVKIRTKQNMRARAHTQHAHERDTIMCVCVCVRSSMVVPLIYFMTETLCMTEVVEVMVIET